MKQLFTQLDEQLRIIQATPAPEQVLDVVGLLLQLLGIQVSPHQRELSLYKEVQDMSYLIKAPGYTDKKAVYEYTDTTHGLEVRVFFCSKIKKAHIAKGVALTPNFEDFPLDKPVNFSKPVSLDFFVEASTGEIVVVTSSEYQLRTMNLKGVLRNTQKTILDKWSPWEVMTGTAKEDIAIKARNHKILRDSLSLKELNKQFYIGDRQHPGIITFFTELKQHILEKHSHGAITFDDKYASQFVARLFGRIIFCEFLRKKGLINEAYGYYTLEGSSAQYYQSKLQYLFFEVLNTEQESRKVPGFAHDIDMHTPFLNGGLFEAKETDFYGQGIISFPDDFFHRFYGFLESYNFTTDESSSDYQQVAIDPEMLGRIFENLLAEESTETGEQARKAKGAFYTPREIVDYMCRESLRQYLLDALGDSPRKEEALSTLMDTKDHEWDRNQVAKIKDEKALLLQALDVCTIIDPACGSGAFPMGMVQLMTRLYERLDSTKNTYHTKFKIIKNSIYGVDIEPMAVEISRLRAWLSLIVDEEFQPQQKNGGIEPLPNLDFKFVCANSLIKLEGSDAKKGEQVGGLFDDDVDKKLMSLRDEWFETKPRKKEQVKKEYLNALSQANGLFLETASLRVQQLAKYNPFNATASAGFFDSKFMFGKSNFDIVIGNPPYVEHKKLKHIAFKFKGKYEVYTGTSDLSVYFFELGLSSLLNKKGILCYINTNKFFNTEYGKKLRSYLLQKNIVNVVNFEQVEVFESVLVSSTIMMVKNSDPDKYPINLVQFKDLKHEQFRETFLSKVYTDSKSFNKDLLDAEERTFDTGISVKIKKKIEQGGKLIKNINGVNIFRGVTTGFNPAYIVDKNYANTLISNDERNKNVIKKLIQGRHIRKWNYNESGEMLIFVPWHFPLHNVNSISGASKEAETTLANEYPTLYNHLVNFKDSLSARNKEETGIRYEWYALQRCASTYYQHFSDEKIVRGLTADKRAFAYDDQQHYLPSNGYILTSTKLPIKYILGLLNSKLLQYYFGFVGVMTAGGAYTLKHATIQKLPLYVPTDSESRQIENIVDMILTSKSQNQNQDVSQFEKQINDIVYKFYGLTDEEIAIVEGK